MTSDETKAAILQFKCLRTLPGDLRHQVAGILEKVAEQRRVPKASVWFHEHEQSKNMGYLLIAGQVKIEKADTPEIVCQAPELLGEMMQFNPMHERTATVSALDDCVVMQFPWEAFWAEIQENCTEADQKKIRSALEEVAWSHITG